MRKETTKKRPMTVPVNLTSSYDFSSLFIYKGALTDSYYLDTVPNERHLLFR